MTSLLISEIFPPTRGGSGRWLSEVYWRMPSEVSVITDLCQPADGKCDDPVYVHRVSMSLDDTGGFSQRGFRDYWKLLRQVIGLAERLSSDGGKLCVQAARVVSEEWLAWLWRMQGGPRYQCFAHGEELNLDGRRSGGMMSRRQHRWMAKLVLAGAGRFIASSENTASMQRD